MVGNVSGKIRYLHVRKPAAPKEVSGHWGILEDGASTSLAKDRSAGIVLRLAVPCSLVAEIVFGMELGPYTCPVPSVGVNVMKAVLTR